MKLRSKPGLDKQKIEDELEKDKHQIVWELYKNHDGYNFANNREAQSSAGLQNIAAMRRPDEYSMIIQPRTRQQRKTPGYPVLFQQGST